MIILKHFNYIYILGISYNIVLKISPKLQKLQKSVTFGTFGWLSLVFWTDMITLSLKV